MNQQAPPFVVRSAPTNPTDLRWTQRQEDLQFEALAKVRSAAEKWAASLGALLGLSGTILVVQGRDDFSKLEDEFRIAVGATLLVAVIIGACATFLAARAAQGTPAHVAWPSGAKLKKWEHEEAVKARGMLTRSRHLAIGAVALVLLALGLTWFGEAKPADADALLVVPREGAPVCGTMAAAADGESVVVTLEGGQEVSLEGSDVGDVIRVDRCP
jgi:hypothetical protein